MRLKDKVALVTGAASGIGRATAALFGQEGAKVMCADLDAAGAEHVARQIADGGGEAASTQADVSQAADVERMVKETVERWGRLDVLVNNAGIYFIQPLTQVPEDEWDRLININLKGVYLGCKYAIPRMVGQGKGAIVNTASIAGLRGSANWTTYCASKGGVVQLTKALAMEVARLNVRVNCVCPGIIDTGMFDQAVDLVAVNREELATTIGEAHPMGRIGRPEEVAAAILFLASEEASFITGVPLSVDGGLWAGSTPQEGLV
ncbi:MAG: SDR family oxidoreductase [Dehalococcoidia bacterium]|nr:MAG: SDR family oxidoreductase [Dehalococcoidia bacterium]